jgi:hypothetical protein
MRAGGTSRDHQSCTDYASPILHTHHHPPPFPPSETAHVPTHVWHGNFASPAHGLRREGDGTLSVSSSERPGRKGDISLFVLFCSRCLGVHYTKLVKFDVFFGEHQIWIDPLKKINHTIVTRLVVPANNDAPCCQGPPSLHHSPGIVISFIYLFVYFPKGALIIMALLLLRTAVVAYYLHTRISFH